jgi:hypothetical protein
MSEASLSSRPLSAGITLLVVCAVFFAVSAADLPSLDYVPALHTWTFHPAPRYLAMDWFWRAGVSLAAGIVTAPLAHLVASRTSPARLAGATRLAFGLAVGLLFWCSVYLAFALATAPRGHASVTHDEG